MAGSLPTHSVLLDLPFEVLADVCQHLILHDLVRIAATCKHFRHSDGDLETAELPTKLPVITALRELAFPRGGQTPSTRPTGCSESWVAYLARCARQRRRRETPPIAAGLQHTLFVNATARLLLCGEGAAEGHEAAWSNTFITISVAAMAEVQFRSVAAGSCHSLALSKDGRVFSWGWNGNGQLGQGDKLDRLSPTLVEGLEGVRGVAAASHHSLGVTHSAAVFRWGCDFLREWRRSFRPIIVEGLGGVRVRQVYAGTGLAFATGEDGELFSWGQGRFGLLGHGDTQVQPSPKRVEAARGVRMRSVSVGVWHALALAEDGLVYAWGGNPLGLLLGNPEVENELLLKPVEALRGVRVGSVAAAQYRSYALADTGELWAWGSEHPRVPPLGHGGLLTPCFLPKPIESLQNVKVDAVSAAQGHTPWRWRTTGVCTCGATRMQPSRARSVWALQSVMWGCACTRRSASRRCVWRVGGGDCTATGSTLFGRSTKRCAMCVCVCVRRK
jgi:hypothetical protein